MAVREVVRLAAAGAREGGGAVGTTPPLSHQLDSSQWGSNLRSTDSVIFLPSTVHVPVLFQPLEELEIILHFAPGYVNSCP